MDIIRALMCSCLILAGLLWMAAPEAPICRIEDYRHYLKAESIGCYRSLLQKQLGRASASDSICETLQVQGNQYIQAGQYQKAYQVYLKLLAIQPWNIPAIKGIARIAFCADQDRKAVRRILCFLQHLQPSPYHHLLLAEMATNTMEPKISFDHKAVRNRTAPYDQGSFGSVPELPVLGIQTIDPTTTFKFGAIIVLALRRSFICSPQKRKTVLSTL